MPLAGIQVIFKITKVTGSPIKAFGDDKYIMSNSLLLQALVGTNKRIPVWFMRQAGRFLPQYQEIRKHHTLDAMFRDPQIVAQVTCLPVDLLKVDAAILFADILTLPMNLGFDITFDSPRGPVIKNPFQSSADFKHLHPLHDIPYLRQAITLINRSLPKNIPLLGFAGSPLTVLCYLVEGGSSTNFRKVFKMAHENPKTFHRLMAFLTDNTIQYLNLQKKSGIKVFQLFDTWGGILREKDYQNLVLPYVKEIFGAVDLPSIYYLKNCHHLLSSMEKAGSDFLSVCETVNFANNAILAKTKKGIQGNLFQGLLYTDETILEKEIKEILIAAKRFKKYIFNLSHGIQPDVPLDKVKFVVELVHKFPWTNKQ